MVLQRHYKPTDSLLSSIWQIRLYRPGDTPNPYEIFVTLTTALQAAERHGIDRSALLVSVTTVDYIDRNRPRVIKWRGKINEQGVQGWQ